MNSIWYKFIDEYKDQIPNRPLSVILESFWWYVQMSGTDEPMFVGNCQERIHFLMGKEL